MIRTVPTGDLGLDVLLDGGFRLVKRLADTESATVLVRGGAGAGKTLVALHTALELAKALHGDVVVACVEILPSEYLAQIRSARPDIEEGRVAELPARPAGGRGPRVFCGLLTELDPDAPDLVASLEALGRDVREAGGEAAVFVVDSLIEGYGIGGSAPRTAVDAVMKFAAQSGRGLVLCEELRGDDASPWVFAADAVIELGVEARERGRWIAVRKNRFGGSVAGRHELDIGAGAHPAVFPEPHAWVARDLREVLHRHGWRFQARAGLPALTWGDGLSPVVDRRDPPLEGAFVVIASALGGVARSLAYALRPYSPPPDHNLVIELDPLVVREGVPAAAVHVPTVQGAARALRLLIERFGRQFTAESPGRPRVERVVVGDLEHVLAAPDALAWVEAVRVFASLVIESGWGVPVIAYTTSAESPPAHASTVLSTYADLKITAPQVTQAHLTHRWRRQSWFLTWTQDVTAVQMSLDQLQRPPGRKINQ